ncbi:hypothetical protein MMC08_007914, partial [Hypocenomyce scalaris]|nr:hypothetical protein [Hypocenomyce scalaris]
TSTPSPTATPATISSAEQQVVPLVAQKRIKTGRVGWARIKGMWWPSRVMRRTGS